MHHSCAVPAERARLFLLKITTVVFLLLPLCHAAQPGNTKELKKEADKRYDDGDYDGAYKLYAQLVANFPKDPEYNFRLGVCMIYSEPDKKKPIPYLKNALANPEEAPPEAEFYLGKAYHINYRFDDAIRQYNKFKETASPSLQKKVGVDREIAACQHGKRLLSNMTDLVVQNKKVLNEADYFRSYDLKNVGGKLLVKPDEFKTPLDKKKKDRSVMFLPRSGDRVYFSSYGEKGDNGRDIYSAQRQPGGGFGKPELVAGINTPFDEDYPFLHPDGTSLYFASKGHNSMGGYDIFRSDLNEGNFTWSAPVNLEFPINSPDDDFLFVTDSLEEMACFSTGRQSPPGKIDVLRIRTERKPINVVVLAGTVEPEKEGQSVESTITVKDAATGKPVGMFSAEPTGDYNMELPNGAKLLFSVATPGLKTQEQEVALPLTQESVAFRQTITYEKGKLKIINDFNPAPKEDSYLQYLAVIEKKAKLDVNDGENRLEMPLAGTGREGAEKNEGTPRPTVVDDGSNIDARGPVDNRQLATMARQDAAESQQEAAQLDKDAADAMQAGRQQKMEADKKLNEAAVAITAAGNIPDPEQRSQAISAAEKLKEEAKSEQVIADKVLSLARALEEDAKIKKQQAILNRQYADELDKVVISGNPESIKKLEALRRQIEELNENKGVAARIEDDRATLAQKQEQARLIGAQNDRLRADLQENATLISAKEAELDKTRKKAKKAELSAEVDNLKAEKAEKEKELDDNNVELAGLQEDIATLERDISLASAIGKPGGTVPRTGTTGVAPSSTLAATTTAPAVTPPRTLPAETPGEIGGDDLKKAEQNVTRLDRGLDEVADGKTLSATFTDPAAQTLSAEANALLEQLQQSREKLKTDIAAARSAIVTGGPGANYTERLTTLNREAEGIMIQAQKLRAEAREATGADKENKTAEARQMEDLANDKLIEAAALTEKQYKREFEGGGRNLEKLIANGKGSQGEREQALMLSGEAELAFSQAADLRAEAATLPAKGARLGSLSNAEEKEAEALLKQREAIDLLKPLNPEVTLEEIDAAGATSEPAPDMSAVNKSVSDLNLLTIKAYNKVYEANEAELGNLASALSSSELKLRADGEADLSESRKLKAIADTISRPEQKTELLLASVNMQQNALLKFQGLKKELDQAIASNEEQEAARKRQLAQQSSSVTGATGIAAGTRTTGTNQGTVTSAAPGSTATTKPPSAAKPGPEITTAAVTTSVQSYFKTNKPLIGDAASQSAFDKSLAELGAASGELAALNEEQPSEGATATATELRARSARLLDEAEALSRRSQEARTSANTLSGAERENKLAEAGKLEETAQQKQLESADVMHKVNEAEIAANDAAITGLIERLRNDDPSAAEQMAQEVADLGSLRTQAAELRQEALNLSNSQARLGGMSNAEEKEGELIQKQADIVNVLKEKYPDFTQEETIVKDVPRADPAARKAGLEDRQVQALDNLNTALNDAYETKQKSIAASLTGPQQKLKQEAAADMARSRKLRAEAATAAVPAQKAARLAESARLSNEALVKVSRLPAAGEPVTAANPRRTAEPAAPAGANTGTTGSTANKTTKAGTARVEGLEVIRGNAYNANRPIPMDAPIGGGLTFRVQVGAFRTMLPNDAFRGLSPLNGETTASGYYRYTAGNFNRIENANAVKNDLRRLGYSDAFVVAYFNGKRVSLAEAMAIMAREGRTVDENAPQTAGITENTNIPRPGAIAAASTPPPAGELEKTNGLLYTIQIGVFNRQVSGSQLYNLLPVYREQLGNGLYRYTAGVYNNPDRLLADKQKVVAMGIRDAFVSAYLNGKRIPFAEAKNRQQSDKSIKTEAEKPIVFPGGSAATPPAAPDVKAFTNSVKSYPTPSPDNGVKSNEQGITFKVQIGAFSREVPAEIAARFSQIKNWPVEHKQLNNLFIYNIGNFSEARFARALKDEAVKLGLSDAFISVYRDGKKLYGPEAAALLGR